MVIQYVDLINQKQKDAKNTSNTTKKTSFDVENGNTMRWMIRVNKNTYYTHDDECEFAQ